MNGINTVFMHDPEWFLAHYTVDNRYVSANYGALDAAKAGLFDLVIVGHNQPVRLTEVAGPVANDVPIPAYWCPFVHGAGVPGWVDIPRVNPPRRFLFTPAMQGCALVVTDSPAGAQLFRVSHNQHPGDDANPGASWQRMAESGITSMTSKLTEAQYVNPHPVAPDVATNAFNLMWRPPGGAWAYLSQSNRLVPQAMSMLLERDPVMPILNLPTGV